MEFLGIQGVEADVQPVHAGLAQGLRHGGQLTAVGGHRKVAQAVSANFLDQFQDILAYHRLAAGEADFFGTQRDKVASDPGDLFQSENLLARQESHVLGHAVHTPEVTPVGDGQAHVVDGAAKTVCQFALGHRVDPVTACFLI